MRIVASQVTLGAATSVARSTSESVRGRAWIGDRPPRDNVKISTAARTTALDAGTLSLASRSDLAGATRQAQSGVSGAANSSRPPPVPSTTQTADVDVVDEDEQLLGSPEGAKLLVMRRLLEALTGKRIELVKAEDLEIGATDQQAIDALAGQAAAADASTTAPRVAARTGWGLELDIERTHIETTAVNFTAQGSIVTEDGHVVTFDASFVKQSASVDVEKITLRAGDAQLRDPLVLLYSGTHAELTQDLQEFDLDANGSVERLPTLANGAYVVQDINHNGRVDDGKELLGALSGDGFADLTAMDRDGNGFVDAGDTGFASLYLWTPGQAEASALTSLADAGLLGLHTGKVSTPFELESADGNLAGRVRSTGIYLTTDGVVRPLEQIDVKA